MHLNIRARLLILTLTLAMLPVIAVTAIATQNSKRLVQNDIVNANESRMVWCNQYIESLFDQLDNLFYTLQTNQSLIGSFNEFDSLDYSTRLSAQKNAWNILNAGFFSESQYIDNLSLYIANCKSVLQVDFANTGTVSPLNIANSEWRLLVHGPVNMYFRRNRQGIYVFHSINSFSDHALLGGISALVDRQIFDKTAGILEADQSSPVILYDESGGVLYTSGKMADFVEIESKLKKIAIDDTGVHYIRSSRYLYFIQHVDDGQISVVKVIPVSKVNESVRSTILAGIVTALIACMVAVLFSILFSLRISRPIIRLAKTMKKAQIQTFKIQPVSNHDEIGVLENCYNLMMQRIQLLIKAEYEQAIELKNAQIKAFQSQINPHFFNNTLQLIGGMALSEKIPGIYEICRVIGSMMRYAINTEENMVPLSEELKNVQNYMFIQEQRFRGRFSMELLVDETAVNNKLPKFTLQPLVENSFEHGLRQKSGEWLVSIRIKKLEKRVGIEIMDNGNGIPESTLCEIRKMLLNGKPEKLNADKESIGLHNINARLKLHFGNRYRLRLYSKEKAGTMIIFEIPIDETEE